MGKNINHLSNGTEVEIVRGGDEILTITSRTEHTTRFFCNEDEGLGVEFGAPTDYSAVNEYGDRVFFPSTKIRSVYE